MLKDKYNHKEVEKKWQEYWADKEIYKFCDDKSKEETFVIDTPPPTVSGVLHMGHVFSYTQADFIARFQRMKGRDVFYPMGFDDNGLPTERLVEKVKNIRVGSENKIENNSGLKFLSREDFIKECVAIVDDAEKEFESLFNSIALSVDWKQKYQTISKKSQALSQASFIDLYNKDFIKYETAPVYWDWADKTALAQADLVDKEIEGQMNYITFEILDPSNNLLSGKINIMTTRPELLPACVSVMINANHKNDDGSLKWQELLKEKLDHNNEGFTGYYAISPIFKAKVKIIADNDVKTDKGTGAVMCCTFGDETDIKWWRKHKLQSRIIIEKDGRISDILNDAETTKILDPNQENISNKTDWLILGGNFNDPIKNDHCLDLNNFKNNYKNLVQGKKIKEAKEIITNELKNLLPEYYQETTKRAVKCAERSGMAIEILLRPELFIKIIDKKNELIKKSQECNWFPQYMQVRIQQWIDGLSWDWCISRQRFFGVAFPMWHSKRKGEEGKILLATIDQLPCDPLNDLPKDPNNRNGTGFYSREEVTAELNIMDTWATSSISPQLSSNGINDFLYSDELNRFVDKELDREYYEKALKKHNKLFPADLRPQAHEIIRTWAFYTIAKAYLHEEKIPWKNLMISGWCLAADKSKMSKSKGNVVTPVNLIQEKGSDVVRYWASTSGLGADTAFSEDVFKIGHKLITKLFNAAKFVEFVSKNADFKLGELSCEQIFYSNEKNNIISEAFDKWILSKLHNTIKNCEEYFNNFEYAKAREEIEDFFWNDFCDNYLEIIKVRAYGIKGEKYSDQELSNEEKEDLKRKQYSALYTLDICLNSIIKILSPFIPHICEEIFSCIYYKEFDEKKSINSRNSWPNYKIIKINNQNKIIESGDGILKIIFEVRKFKSDNNLSMKTTISFITLKNVNIDEFVLDLKNVCNALELVFDKNQEDFIKIKL